jgi:hypothetical protein
MLQHECSLFSPLPPGHVAVPCEHVFRRDCNQIQVTLAGSLGHGPKLGAKHQHQLQSSIPDRTTTSENEKCVMFPADIKVHEDDTFMAASDLQFNSTDPFARSQSLTIAYPRSYYVWC